MLDPESAPTGREIVDGYLEPLAVLPEIAPHNLERVADRVQNICERVVFVVTGRMREFSRGSVG